MSVVRVTLTFDVELTSNVQGVPESLSELSWMTVLVNGLGEAGMKKAGIRAIHRGTRSLEFRAVATREEKDRKLGVKPLAEAICDECARHAFTRWYENHGTKRERVAATLCRDHNLRYVRIMRRPKKTVSA